MSWAASWLEWLELAGSSQGVTISKSGSGELTIAIKEPWIKVNGCSLHIHIYTSTLNTRIEEFATTTEGEW